MLGRWREQMIVLLGLVSLNLGLGWTLRGYWKDYRARTAWIYAQRAPVMPSAPSELSGATVRAQSFAGIVARTIFRPDRGSEGATETAKVPELPILYGTMNLGKGRFALMTPGDQASGPSKQVFTGDEVGGYKLVSIGDSQVIVAWGEKQSTINVWESARRIPRIIEKTAPTTRPTEAPTSAGSTGRVTTVAPPSTQAAATESERRKFTPAGYNAPPGAPVDAAAGTVFGGKRKVVRPTPFGNQVWWEDVEPTKNPEQK